MQFVEDAIEAMLISEAASQRGIHVSRDEVQEAANAFRERNNLLKAQDAIQWLEVRGVTVSEWQGWLEEQELIAKFKKAVFEPKVDTFFAEHKLDFDHATIGRIAAPSESLANELLLQIREEGAVFEEVARKHSVEKSTKDVGGYVGRVTRRDLVAAASSAVFGGKEGSVHGPFKAGKDYHIFRVIALHPATLDDATREQIKSRMFKEWLANARAKAAIEIPLYETPAVVEAK